MGNKKKTLIFISFILMIISGAFIYKYIDDIERYFYFKKGDITKEMMKDKDSYLNKKEIEYFVYFYDDVACEKCDGNIENLMKYENENDNKKIYKINLNKLDKEIVEDYLFLNKENGNFYYIKKGKKEYQLTTNNVPYDFLQNIEVYMNY